MPVRDLGWELVVLGLVRMPRRNKGFELVVLWMGRVSVLLLLLLLVVAIGGVHWRNRV